jgi:hypothetical protein
VRPRFQADADLHADIVTGVLRREPTVDFQTAPGVFLIPQSLPRSRAIDELVLIWSASEADEWHNLLVWLPL